MALDDAGDDVGEVGAGFHADELAGLDQRGDYGPVFRATVRSGKEAVLPVQSERPDGTLDDVGVELDASVVEEQGQPGPAGERVADRVRELALLADESELLAQPGLERFDHRPAARLTGGPAFLGRTAADLGLDAIEGRDAGERLGRDRPGELVERAADVAPAEGELHAATPLGQGLVGFVAVDLQHAPEARQMGDGPAGGAVGRIDEGDARRIGATPGPIVPGIRPELARLRASAARIEHRRRGLVGEQLARSLQGLEEPLVNGPEQEGGAPDPIGERRAIERDALASVDLRLPVERKVVGVFGDEHLRDEVVRRQAALDEPRRRGRLYDRLASPAGVSRPPHHQHAERRRHDVEALGDVLADPMQPARAARAGRAPDVDQRLDARQVSRQGAAVRPPARRALRLHGRRGFLDGVLGSLDLLGLLDAQKKLILGEALGPAPEAVTLHRADDLAQPLVLGTLLGQESLQDLRIVAGQSRLGHEADSTIPARRLPARR